MNTDLDTRAGTLGIGDDGSFRIEFERRLAHPVTTVWAAFADPARLGQWLPGCEIDARPGGAVRYDFGEEGTATGEVSIVEPPSDGASSARLEHTWRWEGQPDSLVTWSLDATDEGTLLRLRHREVLPEPATEFAIA